MTIIFFGSKNLQLAAYDSKDLQHLLTYRCFGGDLSNADLSGKNFTHANIHKANLRGVYLTGANLKDANLSGAH